MYARVPTFESDPSRVDDSIEVVRSSVESEDTPEGLEGAKMLMLVNRETGKGVGITLFDSEDAMRRGDEALNAMNPGASERRTSVEFLRGAGSDRALTGCGAAPQQRPQRPRVKTLITDTGPVRIDTPRDREGGFEPQIVRKRSRRARSTRWASERAAATTRCSSSRQSSR